VRINRVRRVALAAFLVVIVMLAVVSYLGPRQVLMTGVTLTWPRRFSQEQWREHPKERYLMAFDLDQRGLLRGKTEQQVRQLLGDPSGVYSGSPEGDLLLAWNVAYPHGPRDSLTVNFHNGVVEAWGIGGDPLWAPQHR
jgi:hypothetical protein